MRVLAMALALTMLPVPAIAATPDIFEAILSEKASGFRDMAECQKALGDEALERGDANAGKQEAPRGSHFNRTRGNISRCEMFEGEPLIVVYPKGHGRTTPLRDGIPR